MDRAIRQRNFGILASISWNSNGWKGLSTEEDIDKSGFPNVKKHRKNFDDLNFGMDVYSSEEDGKYIGHSPQLTRFYQLAEQSRYVEIVFLKSLNYHDGKNYIVGFYAFPEIGQQFKRTGVHKEYEIYPAGNLKANKEYITQFEFPIDVTENGRNLTGVLPAGRGMGRQGFNYLKYDNVLKILDLATMLNPQNVVIRNVKMKILSDKKFEAYQIK